MKRIITAALGLIMAFASLAFTATTAPRAATSGGIAQRAGGVRGVDEATYNWSGYADTNAGNGALFTKVTGSWQEPYANCLGTADESHVIWVGLDGFNDSTVEQGGTWAICKGTTPVYYAWWEMYPSNYITIFPNFAVHPGDMMKATVSYTGGKYKITVADNTTAHKHSASATTSCAATVCTRQSAEWIAEAPSFGSTIGNLAEWYNTKSIAKFGTFAGFATETYKGLSKTFPINGFDSFSIGMVNQADTYYLAAPGALGSNGQGFSNYWYAEG